MAFTGKELNTVNTNWNGGISPKQCNGKCKIVEGGGEVKCYSCGWDDDYHLINYSKNNDEKEK